MSFTVVIEKRALKDVQKVINYYDEQQPIGLAEKFNAALNKHIATIATNPFYQLRYKDYRVLPIKKFPYLIYSTLTKTLRLYLYRLYLIPNNTQTNYPDKYSCLSDILR
jgi:toxin ParE1/3/4